MLLTDIDIPSLVQDETVQLVEHLDYDSLRASLLATEALSTVLKIVDDEIDDRAVKDKTSSANSATVNACDMQRTHDHQEASADREQEQEDTRLQAQYQQELLELNQKQIGLNNERLVAKNLYNEANSRWSDLEANLRSLDQSIDFIRSQRLMQMSEALLFSNSHSHMSMMHHHHNHSFPSSMHHHHNHHIPMHHHHHHHNLFHPRFNDFQMYHGFGPMRAARLMFRMHSDRPMYCSFIDNQFYSLESNRLQSDRRILQEMISTARGHLNQCSRNYDAINSEWSRVSNRCDTLSNALQVEIPTRELQRQRRLKDRGIRNAATTVSGKLSPQNYSFLNAEIDRNHAEIDRKVLDLKNEAKARSYPAFVTEVQDQALTHHGLSVNAPERQAITKIAEHMQIYIALQNREKALIDALHVSRNTHADLNRKMADNRHKLQGNSVKIDGLQKEISSYTDTNKRLKQKVLHAEKSRNKTLAPVIIGFAGAGISALIIGLIGFPPLQLITGVLALMGIIASIFAIVETCKKSSAKKRIKHTDKKIQTAGEELSPLRLESNHMYINLPSISSEIDNSSDTMNSQQSELDDVQAEMRRVLAKATNVGFASANRYALFDDGRDEERAENQQKIKDSDWRWNNAYAQNM